MASILLLPACVSEPLGGPLILEVKADGPVAALQTINKAGARCWTGASDSDFDRLQLVPELDTEAGRPRLLVVQRGRTEGLPALVIEAHGSPVTIETYGPLASTRTGGRINADIMRWSAGPATCRG